MGIYLFRRSGPESWAYMAGDPVSVITPLLLSPRAGATHCQPGAPHLPAGWRLCGPVDPFEDPIGDPEIERRVLGLFP